MKLRRRNSTGSIFSSRAAVSTMRSTTYVASDDPRRGMHRPAGVGEYAVD
jgi:hypothetical protein